MDNPLVMGLFLKFKPKQKTKKALMENQTLRNLYPGKLGTLLKCLGAKLQGPKLNFIFR